ncbi:ribokinase [Chryseobacterium sp. Leaf405]|uniref:carbohydrate kinase family protein n=1 Tax=Chryseobacterium sp. Leaf405 TaxID=1736367 RepID=UPI0006F347FB|nr:carbohydrate kinase [Chryseobacterium sp. Leaf405]KQT35475.1 ribokinase [Chryseobacterium sp. Leaf405]
MVNENSYVVCFGEVLWDIFPNGSKAGGAPFNVAYNLHKMGIDVKMLSKVGNDDLGKKLIQQISQWGITTDYIQIGEKNPTSTVIAKIDEHNEANYEIVKDVAWDYIELLPEHKELISNADAFVFGSLSARDEKTKETLLQLLEYAPLKIFDVNFRPPFVDTELIKMLLFKANIVKMNQAEMNIILSFIDEEYRNIEDSLLIIANHFNTKEIILTKGSEGAEYFFNNKQYQFNALPIKIDDTVGSGDAFLAGFVSKRIKNESPEEIMKQAVSLGAFITSKSGACPHYDYEEFEKLKETYSL